jgi:UDP-N-acetylmuramoyl-L-alanyl-D-glutamate--2,6-diaminopimelate ligase
LIAVFGAAGERDTTKRPLMGAAAAKLADFAIFTNEDPRAEDSAQILAEIAAGASVVGWQEGRHYLKIVDRRAAIEAAFLHANPGDTVVLLGKGHEQSIIVGNVATPWDERQVAREILKNLELDRS